MQSLPQISRKEILNWKLNYHRWRYTLRPQVISHFASTDNFLTYTQRLLDEANRLLYELDPDRKETFDSVDNSPARRTARLRNSIYR